MAQFIPLLSAIVSFVFALLVFDQYLRRRKPYQAVWSLSLVFYGLATLAEHLARGGGWTPQLYQAFYVSGGLWAAVSLGLGTVYLMAPRRWANAALLLVVALGLFGAARVIATPLDPALLPAGGRPGGAHLLPADVRVLAAVLNTLGTVWLVGGALWSARALWRQPERRYRFWSNLLIAAGALFSAAGGTVLGYSGAVLGIELPDVFSLATLIGVVLIFVGFLVSIEVFERFNVPFTRWTIGRRGRAPSAPLPGAPRPSR